MFNDIGKKIKGLCKIVFYISLVAVGIVGIVVFATGVEYSNEPVGLFFLMLLIWGAGALISYLLVLFLYAFGELVDTNLTLVKQNDKIIKMMLPKNKDEQKEENNESLVKYFNNEGK